MAAVSPCKAPSACWCMVRDAQACPAWSQRVVNHHGGQDKALLEKVFVPLEKMGLPMAVRVQQMLQKMVS